MALDDVKLWGEVLRGTPSGATDGQSRPLRISRNGELMTRDVTRRVKADEGNYYTIGTTPATGIAGHAAPTTLDDTKPYVWLMNTHTAAEGKRIHLDYLRTWVTAAGTGGTALRYGIKTDTGTARRTSAGTLMTNTNVNPQSTNTLSATVYQGAVVAAAASSAVRIATHGLIRTVINVIGDEYLFLFGEGAQANAGAPSEGTLQLKTIHTCPAIVLGANDQFLFHFFSPSQSAASSHEVEIGCWVE
jgi:hypothetical protein